MPSERFRAFLRHLLLLDEPPERTAAAFGWGLFLGFSPFVGLHSAIAVLVLFVIRLNRLAFLAGVYLNSPWLVAPSMALGTGIGLFVLGRDAEVPEITFDTILSGELWNELTRDGWELLVPYFVGNFVLATVSALLGYWLLKRFLLRYRRRRRKGDRLAAAASD